MSTSTLKVGSDIASALGDCEVGESKTISVTGTVTSIGDDGAVEMNVESVAYEPDEDDEGEPGEAPSKRDKVPSAVLMLLGKGK